MKSSFTRAVCFTLVAGMVIEPAPAAKAKNAPVARPAPG